MRGNEFLNKMDLIDPAYIEAADAAPRVRKTTWTGWRAAMAACICLVLLAGTAAAVSGGGTWLIGIFSGGETGGNGYERGADIGVIPVSELSENLQRVSEEIVYQFEVCQPAGSWAPGHWSESSFSADEAWAFIGLASMKKPDWDMEEWYNNLLVYGDRSGRIKAIVINTGYQAGDIRFQARAMIKTENLKEIRTRSICEEGIRYTETFYPTPGGNSCQIISSSANEKGYLMLDGYLVENGVLDSLHIPYQGQDAARAEELLYQWADMF